VKTFPFILVSIVVLAACSNPPTDSSNHPGRKDTTLCFDRDVLPIFLTNCARAGCHDPGSRQKGFNLTSHTGILEGITPGEPFSSLIYIKITEEEESDRMPPWPREELEEHDIAIIRQWIMEGATDSSCTSSGEHPCDTSSVTYSQTIRPILNAECIGCHTVAADTNMNVDLSNYAGVQKAVESGQLYGSVTHSLGYSQMPSINDTLTKCQLLQIQDWIDNGALNN
jgi:mono/diheme cytochrome c family protein